jgi:glycosyltransferase involved in cell wall biosynthesis
MIPYSISTSVLTVGPAFDTKGGMAQVLKSYSKNVYKKFNFIPSTSSSHKFFYGFRALILYLYYLIFRREIRVVHIHSASHKSFWRKRIFLYIGKLFNKKIILHIHGAEFKLFAGRHRQSVCKALQSADAVVALSNSWKTFLEQECGCHNVTVVDNIVDKPVETSTECVGNKPCQLLFLGYLSKRKGIYDLLEAIGENRVAYFGKIRLVIGGNGETEQVTDFIKRNNIDDIVDFKGYIEGDDKKRLLATSDIYILPSYNEGQPISILEAMSYGLPVISTKAGGIPEIIEDGVNGLLIDAGNKEQIRDAINKLINDKELRQSMGRCNATQVTAHFPDEVSCILEKLYKTLISK